MNNIISNDIITLRSLEVTDLDTMHQWENDPELWSVSNIMAPTPRSVLWQYLKDYDTDIFRAGQLRLMVTLSHSGQPVGTVDLLNLDALNRRAELGVMIIEEQRHKGLAHEAVKLMVDYARNFLGLSQLYALVPQGNNDCRNVLCTCGFSTSGTLKKWINHGATTLDVNIMQLIL